MMAQTREAALAYLCGQLAHALADATNDPDLLVKVGEKVAQIEEQGDPYTFDRVGYLLAPNAADVAVEQDALDPPADPASARAGLGYSVWVGNMGPSQGVEEYIRFLKGLTGTYDSHRGQMILSVSTIRTLCQYVWFPDGWTPDGEQA